MSSALPPDSDPAGTAPPPEESSSSPGDDEIATPPATGIPIQVPLPSLSPPQSGSISPSTLAAFPPTLPIVVGTIPPTTTLSPVSSQPPPLPSSPPQPPIQPPVIPPTPITKDIPPPIITPPPNVPPPTDNKPVIVTQPPSSPPLLTSPLPPVRNPIPGPATTKPGPLEPGPLSPPPLPTSPIPPVRQTKTTSATTKPVPLEPVPSTPPLPTSPIPVVRNPITRPGPSSSSPPPHSPLAASAVLPSQPPVALPVPQTPRGGAWFPAMSAPPSILPSIPGTPGVVNSPLFGGSNDGASSSSSSSSLAPTGAGHQNIESSVASSNGSSVLVLGLVVGVVLLVVFGAVFGILVIFCRRRHRKFDDHGFGEMHGSSIKGFEDKSTLPQYTKQGSNTPRYQLPADPTPPQAHSTAKAGPTSGVGAHHSSGTFSYDELAAATSAFSDQNLLGQGGFGYVYKGVLPNRKEVAVKQLKMGGDQGEREFRAEVDTISQVHHKHLVSLVGFCISGPERLLVYEFVGNNTLDFHLHGKDQPVMDWPTRLKIAIGSAKGLAYLHEDCSPFIIHRDIKAANILLDFNFEAKVSDFGLAKFFSSTNPAVTHITTRVVGTFGYLAPEYASSGKVTDKSDVYSYGVVLLELITGRPPISDFGPATNGSLVNWARPLLAQAIADGNFDTLADSRLQNNYDVNEMISMVSCAAACVRVSSWRRPRMSQVIRALEGNLSASELDSGIKPGHSSMHFPYESLDFDAHNYIDNMKRMALASRYSDNTSDYGLDHSASSTDSTQHIC